MVGVNIFQVLVLSPLVRHEIQFRTSVLDHRMEWSLCRDGMGETLEPPTLHPALGDAIMNPPLQHGLGGLDQMLPQIGQCLFSKP